MVDRQKEFSGTGPVRQGFELDHESLQQYMQENVAGFSGPLSIEQFKGGQSNPTYLLSSGAQKYVLRRKPSGKLLKSAHAVDREYKVISALNQTDVPVAKAYALCTDDAVIGSWFYIMEYVEGRIFWAVKHTPVDQRQAIFEAMHATIAKLHQVDFEAVGLVDYGTKGSYFSRQISRWASQYRASVEEPCTVMDELIEWLTDHIPANDETAIVHGDFRIDNLIFHPTEPRILAILDWELSTLGHPLSDFAYSCMLYYVPAGLGFGGLGGMDLKANNIPTIETCIRSYCREMALDGIPDWYYYMAFNFFRLAGIAFGIKGRVRDGTAASHQAKATAAIAEPLAEIAMQLARKS